MNQTDSQKKNLRVTFTCRVPDALRAGCGAAVGIIHYSKFQAAPDGAPASSPTHPSRRSVLAPTDLATEDWGRHAAVAPPLSRFTRHSARTPVMDSGALPMELDGDYSAADHPEEGDHYPPEETLEYARRQQISRESSWVVMSPPRSSGIVTPASIRLTASCGTDLCEDEALEDASAPVSLRNSDWDILSPQTTPSKTTPLAYHRRRVVTGKYLITSS